MDECGAPAFRDQRLTAEKDNTRFRFLCVRENTGKIEVIGLEGVAIQPGIVEDLLIRR